MPATRNIIQFALAAVMVAIIGGFAGWYFYIQNNIDSTQAMDAARGLGEDTSFASPTGSNYQNVASNSAIATSSQSEVGKRAPRLWQVSRNPVAGFGFSGATSKLFFAERATGNVLTADPEASSIFRLTNTLFPKVHEASFSRSGDVILRFPDDQGVIRSFAALIATTSASITATSTPNVLQGVYFPDDIASLDLQDHQSTAKGVFYIAPNPAGGSVGATANWKGASTKKIFTSPLVQWQSQWLPDGRVVITQNASDNVAGYSFIVGASGVMKQLVGDLPGLTVLHHDTGEAYLFSTSKDGLLEFFVQTTAKGTPVALPIRTTAQKCVWAPGSGMIAYCAVPQSIAAPEFLSRWYQGALHTSDVLWKIEAGAGKAERFFIPDSRTVLDVENAAMDEGGTHIGFRNATDKSLWLLRIAE